MPSVVVECTVLRRPGLWSSEPKVPSGITMPSSAREKTSMYADVSASSRTSPLRPAYKATISTVDHAHWVPGAWSSPTSLPPQPWGSNNEQSESAALRMELQDARNELRMQQSLMAFHERRLREIESRSPERGRSPAQSPVTPQFAAPGPVHTASDRELQSLLQQTEEEKAKIESMLKAREDETAQYQMALQQELQAEANRKLEIQRALEHEQQNRVNLEKQCREQYDAYQSQIQSAVGDRDRRIQELEAQLASQQQELVDREKQLQLIPQAVDSILQQASPGSRRASMTNGASYPGGSPQSRVSMSGPRASLEPSQPSSAASRGSMPPMEMPSMPQMPDLGTMAREGPTVNGLMEAGSRRGSYSEAPRQSATQTRQSFQAAGVPEALRQSFSASPDRQSFVDPAFGAVQEAPRQSISSVHEAPRLSMTASAPGEPRQSISSQHGPPSARGSLRFSPPETPLPVEQPLGDATRLPEPPAIPTVDAGPLLNYQPEPSDPLDVKVAEIIAQLRLPDGALGGDLVRNNAGKYKLMDGSAKGKNLFFKMMDGSASVRVGGAFLPLNEWLLGEAAKHAPLPRRSTKPADDDDEDMEFEMPNPYANV